MNLLDYCRTERQTEAVLAYKETGSYSKAAKKLGINTSSMRNIILRVESYVNGPKPKASTVHYRDGEVVNEWIRLENKVETAQELIAGLEIPSHKKFKAPKKTDKSALTVYPIADLHIGMLSWAAETGVDYDTKIAVELANKAIQTTVDRSPPSGTAMIANLGDITHFFDDSKRTRSGHQLDADTRWVYVMRAASAVMQLATNIALTKHKTVHVYNSFGNHCGPAASILQWVLKEHYQNEPRVIVNTEPKLHHYFHFGKNMLALHHGHTTTPKKFAEVILNSLIGMEKAPTHLHGLQGHIHHVTQEFSGVLIETFRTLAARDVWHDGQGYRAGREMQSITYDIEHGQQHREIVNLSEVA